MMSYFQFLEREGAFSLFIYLFITCLMIYGADEKDFEYVLGIRWCDRYTNSCCSLTVLDRKSVV